jgi:hypothetical protein
MARVTFALRAFPRKCNGHLSAGDSHVEVLYIPGEWFTVGCGTHLPRYLELLLAGVSRLRNR